MSEDEFRTRIESAIAAKSKFDADQKQKSDAKEERERESYLKFETIVDETIRPTVEIFRRILRESRIDSEVIEEMMRQSISRINHAKLRVDFFPEHKKGGFHNPSVTFGHAPGEDTIYVAYSDMTRTGGSTGHLTNLSYSVTSEEVMGILVAHFEKVMAKLIR